LRAIGLRGNKISDEGATLLADFVRRSPVLELVSIKANKLTKEGENALKSAQLERKERGLDVVILM
jgi:Ran GTPase-activating protein (RanGAP) involved in mRNA processing and transport